MEFNQKVYVETSVVSYYTSRPSQDIVVMARQEITREWWTEHLSSFQSYISVLVLNEAKSGDLDAANQRLIAVADMPILEITSEAQYLAEKFIYKKAIPEAFPEDALHIALAAVNGIDFLVTWNFAHINNVVTKKKIASVCEENGYECTILCSPEELLGGHHDEI